MEGGGGREGKREREGEGAPREDKREGGKEVLSDWVMTECVYIQSAPDFVHIMPLVKIKI